MDGADILFWCVVFSILLFSMVLDLKGIFFLGGTMPSHDLLVRSMSPPSPPSPTYSLLLSKQLYFQSDLTLLRSWYISGTNYSQTSEHWLKLQDKNKKAGLAELEADAEAKGLSREEGRKAFYRFRVFYIAVAEFFGLNGGDEWGVGHYLFKAKDL